MKITTSTKEFLADLHSPVGIFLKIREHYAQALLLESSDYANKENSHSFICFSPIAGFSVDDNIFRSYFIDHSEEEIINGNLNKLIEAHKSKISLSLGSEKLDYNGYFGYTNYDAIQHFDSIALNKKEYSKIPSIRYDFYRYIICIDHFYGKLKIIENIPEGEGNKISEIEKILLNQNYTQFAFSLKGDVESTLTNSQFKSNVSTAKTHCKRGDVFQVVLSRRYTQKFKGDEFNVYRTLRSINPSPYLFYFDYSNYRLFGSSPEAQIILQNGEAEIHPIAGTVPRTGDEEKDIAYAEQLINDPKENAEHVMLVDLARNDLSRNCDDVTVASYKEIQKFSHVMHLVSVVKGKKNNASEAYQIFSDTFPAGTLSGAPKYRAMQIIDNLEPHKRGFYGGAIGFMGLNAELNHAIIIRSFFSKNKCLHWQAGAGIVIDSDEEKELQEVNNKLGALRKALVKAEEL